ncbi:hypothetical protein DIT71_05205 [Marinobacter vulgaris]|uniref:Uncharacterized protein n=1 Tax=Marinobacter vulgaris TaxID=1928331 RepID=A0A2V3ZNA5_9GAMM|nr:hypothetical protein [Marinobacter vulgaris]PXX92589.1 hypothetical protein DIT71_05205 [Marinobacter vulgaris]TSJ71467.1 hypothetical protein FPC41_04260 [Marinobacter vulgaris]
MDKHADFPEGTFQPRSVNLDQHDSVRSHVCQQIRSEVEQLERRIESLRLTDAPHAAIMISTYERMIDRKKGFLRHWNMLGSASY